jgi:hypothetical protein
MSEKEDSLESVIDKYMAFLHLCEVIEDDRTKFGVKLSCMDGAIPLCRAIGDNYMDELEVLIPRKGEDLPLWPVDTKVVSPSIGEVGSLGFQAVKTIDALYARKLASSIFSKRMLMHAQVLARPDGTALSSSAPYAIINNNITPAAPKHLSYAYPTNGITISSCIQLTARYEWSVWIGFNYGPRLRFISDPQGAIAAFNLRDVPPGKSRRSALLNWVSSHWRSKRDDADSKAWIRKHLRGSQEFNWNGMRLYIQPPQFEVEQLEKRPKKSGPPPQIQSITKTHIQMHS